MELLNCYMQKKHSIKYQLVPSFAEYLKKLSLIVGIIEQKNQKYFDNNKFLLT